MEARWRAILEIVLVLAWFPDPLVGFEGGSESYFRCLGLSSTGKGVEKLKEGAEECSSNLGISPSRNVITLMELRRKRRDAFDSMVEPVFQ